MPCCFRKRLYLGQCAYEVVVANNNQKAFGIFVDDLMNRKFIYFINPISGTKNKEAVLALIKERTAKAGISFEILHTNAAAEYGFLKEKIKADKITDIIICGGDGTVNQVAGSLIDTDVNIGIIPLGSGNGLALAAGIPRNPSKALDIIFKGNASYIDGFFINQKFSCMLCGLGFDALVAHEFAAHPSRGLNTYVKLTLKNFLSASFYPFTITTNGTSITTEAFFISIANSNQFGNNFTIAPKASLSDGLLDIVIVNRMSRLKMLYAIMKQVRLGKVEPASGKLRKGSIQYIQAKKIEIKNPAQAPLHIDGDPAATSQHFSIDIAEKAFRLLQP